MKNQSNQKGRITDFDKIVSQNLKIQRIKFNLNQEQLGKVINVSIQQIQKYEKGINRISAGNLYKIANFFKLKVEDFFVNSPEVTDIIEIIHDSKNDSGQSAMNTLKFFHKIQNKKTKQKLLELMLESA